MSKKIIFIVLVIIAAGIGYWLYQSKPIIALDSRNCAYTVEGKNILLENGYAEEGITADSAAKLTTTYFGNETMGDFNGDGLSDTVFLLTQNSGGSGTFYYAVVALGAENGCQGTNAILLGDRIAPQTTEFRNGKIIVNYADRLSGQPMTADPSLGVSKYLKVENNALIEIQK
jgi:hypothetical protein